MGSLFKDTEHLVQMASLFAAGMVIFIMAKASLVPDGFGRHGSCHADAIAEIKARVLTDAARPQVVAGEASSVVSS
jgi:hypothetical protein